jgi:hypothetical protein
MARRIAVDQGPVASLRAILPGLGLPTDAPPPLVQDVTASTSQSMREIRIQPS